MATKGKDNRGGKNRDTKGNRHSDNAKDSNTSQPIRIKRPPITKLFLENHNRPALGRKEFYQIRELKGIVLHWTANLNKGANARANRNYFNNTTRKCSAHYIIDDKEIIQCLPDNEVGYHCGDKPKGVYMHAGLQMIEGTRLTPNFFTIGIEMCVNLDGDFKETLRNTVSLIKYLKSIHGKDIPLLRHYDITGKKCPKHKVHGRWKLIDKRDWKLIQNMCQI